VLFAVVESVTLREFPSFQYKKGSTTTHVKQWRKENMSRIKKLLIFIIALFFAVAGVIALVPLYNKPVHHELMIEGINLLCCAPNYPDLDNNPYHLKTETDQLTTWSDAASSGENGLVFAITEINALDTTPLYLKASVIVTQDGEVIEGLGVTVTATYITYWAGSGASHYPTISEHETAQLILDEAWQIDYTKMTWDPDTNFLYGDTGPNALRITISFDDTLILGIIAGLIDVDFTFEIGKL